MTCVRATALNDDHTCFCSVKVIFGTPQGHIDCRNSCETRLFHLHDYIFFFDVFEEALVQENPSKDE
jgi:hypothetical protein